MVEAVRPRCGRRRNFILRTPRATNSTGMLGSPGLTKWLGERTLTQVAAVARGHRPRNDDGDNEGAVEGERKRASGKLI